VDFEEEFLGLKLLDSRRKYWNEALPTNLAHSVSLNLSDI